MDGGRVGRALRLRALLAEAGDGEQHDVLPLRSQRFVAEAQPRQHARAEVLDHQIRLPCQPLDDVHALGLGQVHADAALAGVLLVEVARHAAQHSAPQAREVPGRRFHLYYVRTEVAQHPAGERAGEHPREIEHLDVC